MVEYALFSIFVVVSILLTMKNPLCAFGPLLTVFVIDQYFESTSTFFASNNQIINGFVFALVILAACKTLLVKGLPSKSHVYDTFLSLILFAYSLISVVWNVDNGAISSRTEINIYYVVIYVVVGGLLIRHWRDVYTAYKSIMYFGVVFLVLLVAGGELTNRGVASSILLDQWGNAQRLNYLAIGQISGYIALICALGPRLIRKRWGPHLQIAVCIFCIFCSALSGARVQTVLIVFVIAVLFNFRFQTKYSRSIFLLSLVLGTVYLLGGYIELPWLTDDTSRWSASVLDSTNWRLTAIQDAIGMWINSDALTLLFGLGNSSLQSVFGYYPHNLIVEQITESGLIGFVLMVSVFLAYLGSIKKLFTYTANDGGARAFFLPFVGLFLYSLGLSMKQGALFDWYTLFLFGLILRSIERSCRRELS